MCSADVNMCYNNRTSVCARQMFTCCYNNRTSVCAQLMVDLNLERSTWQLVHALYSDRINTQLMGDDDWEQESMAIDLTVSVCVCLCVCACVRVCVRVCV